MTASLALKLSCDISVSRRGPLGVTVAPIGIGGAQAASNASVNRLSRNKLLRMILPPCPLLLVASWPLASCLLLLVSCLLCTTNSTPSSTRTRATGSVSTLLMPSVEPKVSVASHRGHSSPRVVIPVTCGVRARRETVSPT